MQESFFTKNRLSCIFSLNYRELANSKVNQLYCCICYFQYKYNISSQKGRKLVNEYIQLCFNKCNLQMIKDFISTGYKIICFNELLRYGINR